MTVRFIAKGRAIDIPSDPSALLSDLACAAGLPLQTACGGQGACGRCAVILRKGRFAGREGEFEVPEDRPRRALACRTRVAGTGAIVEVPPASLIETRGQIDADFMMPAYERSPRQRVLAVEVAPGTLESQAPDAERLASALAGAGLTDVRVDLAAVRDLPAVLRADGGRVSVACGPYRGATDLTALAPGSAPLRNVAVAADIGTTTVVGVLLDLDRGVELARASAYNAQIRRADDVNARISHARGAAERAELQRLVVEETLNPLIAQLARDEDIVPAAIPRIAVSGNTVMMHLLLGLPPDGIGAIPFQPVMRRYPESRARDVGLRLHPRAVLDIVPGLSGHVGGDLTSDAHAAGLLDRPGLTMLVDIGTNGEILLWNGERLLATATAAGPAFEGAGMECGCRAAEGAVDHVQWLDEGRFRFSVIGKAPATGFCGSAIIDFLAQAFRGGLLGPTGRFDLDRLRRAGCHTEIDGRRGRSHACVVVPPAESATGAPLIVTERDVAEVLKAKAAIYTGMQTLLAVSGHAWSDLDRLLLAGGFARHIRLRHAAWMGLLPDLPPGRIEVIGNGSLAGACLALLDRGAIEGFERILRRAEAVELNLQPGFEGRYVDALLLPHAEPAEFVTALEEMRR